MALKKITRSEVRDISKLLATYWKERGMPHFNERWARGYLKEGHRKEIANDEFFAYKERGRIVGTVSLITDVSNVAEIRDMVVKPEYRKKGYGRKMLAEVVRIAEQRGIRKVYACVFPVFESMFKNAGFVKEGTLKSHFAAGEDLIVMGRVLQ